jgi:hypothetical protein
MTQLGFDFTRLPCVDEDITATKPKCGAAAAHLLFEGPFAFGACVPDVST